MPWSRAQKSKTLCKCTSEISRKNTNRFWPRYKDWSPSSQMKYHFFWFRRDCDCGSKNWRSFWNFCRKEKRNVNRCPLEKSEIWPKLGCSVSWWPRSSMFKKRNFLRTSWWEARVRLLKNWFQNTRLQKLHLKSKNPHLWDLQWPNLRRKNESRRSEKRHLKVDLKNRVNISKNQNTWPSSRFLRRKATSTNSFLAKKEAQNHYWKRHHMPSWLRSALDLKKFKERKHHSRSWNPRLFKLKFRNLSPSPKSIVRGSNSSWSQFSIPWSLKYSKWKAVRSSLIFMFSLWILKSRSTLTPKMTFKNIQLWNSKF